MFLDLPLVFFSQVTYVVLSTSLALTTNFRFDCFQIFNSRLNYVFSSSFLFVYQILQTYQLTFQILIICSPLTRSFLNLDDNLISIFCPNMKFYVTLDSNFSHHVCQQNVLANFHQIYIFTQSYSSSINCHSSVTY